MAKRFFYACAGLFLLAGVYAMGARNAGADLHSSQEVAVLSGEIAHGGVIPLPQYQDGSEALESECHWIVSPQDLALDQNIQNMRCSSENRLVRVYMCHPNSGDGDNCTNFGGTGGTAHYLIVAVRNLTPTSAEGESFGGVKAKYR